MGSKPLRRGGERPSSQLFSSISKALSTKWGKWGEWGEWGKWGNTKWGNM